MDCDAAWCCGRIQMFQRSLLPPSSVVTTQKTLTCTMNVDHHENRCHKHTSLVQGTSWEHVPSDQTLASVSCGAEKQVWAVGRNGSAYWRFGITSSNPIGKLQPHM
jgi:hypothetical protein